MSRRFAPVLALFLSACAQLPNDFPKPESHTLSNTADTTLGRAAAPAVATQGRRGESGLHLLGGGLDSFVARAVLAEKAQRSIDARSYILNNDVSGSLFISQLLKAADRGVRVRLLVDDMGTSGIDRGGVGLNSHPNVEVRVFNPFGRGGARLIQMVTRFGSVTRRMHNKSFTVDNQFTIVGGRNIGDEYFGADPSLNFGDLDTVVIGSAVSEVSASFDDYWNDALAYPLAALVKKKPDQAEIARLRSNLNTATNAPESDKYRKALSGSDLARSLRNGSLTFSWGQAEVIADAPEKLSSPRSATALHLTTKLKPHFEATKRELIISSPYFVPTRKGVDFLAGLARRGVRVRVLTNSLASTDVPAVHGGYSKYRKDLLRAGIEIYEVDHGTKTLGEKDVRWLGGVSKTSLHAKAFIFDREKAFIGSFNFDPRSAKENTEIGIVVKSPKIAGRMATRFDKKLEGTAFRLEMVGSRNGRGGQLRWFQNDNGETRTYSRDPHTTFLQRLGVGLTKLLPIESQL